MGAFYIYATLTGRSRSFELTWSITVRTVCSDFHADMKVLLFLLAGARKGAIPFLRKVKHFWVCLCHQLS